MTCDIAFPSACENELDERDAKKLLNNGCRCVTEAANMPVTENGMTVRLESDILYSPGKASNAAGVACSGLEMAQNSSKIRWTPEEVDLRLRTIMKGIHDTCLDAAERYGDNGNYFFGTNVAGFIKVANAMIDQGNT
jgi:glutamate dehydrogenase (NADP+)